MQRRGQRGTVPVGSLGVDVLDPAAGQEPLDLLGVATQSYPHPYDESSRCPGRTVQVRPAGHGVDEARRPGLGLGLGLVEPKVAEGVGEEGVGEEAAAAAAAALADAAQICQRGECTGLLSTEQVLPEVLWPGAEAAETGQVADELVDLVATDRRGLDLAPKTLLELVQAVRVVVMVVAMVVAGAAVAVIVAAATDRRGLDLAPKTLLELVQVVCGVVMVVAGAAVAVIVAAVLVPTDVGGAAGYEPVLGSVHRLREAVEFVRGVVHHAEVIIVGLVFVVTGKDRFQHRKHL